MAKRKRKASSGLAGLGNEFLADLRGEVVHCVRYGKGKSGQIRCKRFGKGAGKPNPQSRKRAGVKAKFRERSKIRGRKPRKGRTAASKKRCIKFGRGKGGRKVCRKWSPTGKPLKSASRRVKVRGTRRAGKGRCIKWSKGRTRCLKRAASTAKRRPAKKRRVTKRKSAARNGRTKAVRRAGKGRCIKWSKGRTRCLKRAPSKARKKASNGRRKSGTTRMKATKARRVTVLRGAR
jgi:hypothetical protein